MDNAIGEAHTRAQSPINGHREEQMLENVFIQRFGFLLAAAFLLASLAAGSLSGLYGWDIARSMRVVADIGTYVSIAALAVFAIAAAACVVMKRSADHARVAIAWCVIVLMVFRAIVPLEGGSSLLATIIVAFFAPVVTTFVAMLLVPQKRHLLPYHKRMAFILCAVAPGVAAVLAWHLGFGLAWGANAPLAAGIVAALLGVSALLVPHLSRHEPEETDAMA